MIDGRFGEWPSNEMFQNRTTLVILKRNVVKSNTLARGVHLSVPHTYRSTCMIFGGNPLQLCSFGTAWHYQGRIYTLTTPCPSLRRQRDHYRAYTGCNIICKDTEESILSVPEVDCVHPMIEVERQTLILTTGTTVTEFCRVFQ